MNIEALLEQAMADPYKLLERILTQVFDDLGRHGSIPGYQNMPPEDLLATALGNWVTRMLAEPEPPGIIDTTATNHESTDWDLYAQLLDRSSTLAAAVGACDCWGEQPDCPFCDGDGAAGWIRPDRQLFAKYVYPALRALPPMGASNGRRRPVNEAQTKGNDDD